MTEGLSILEFFKASTRLRLKRIVLAASCVVVLAIIVVRQREAEYEARVKLFAGLPTSATLAGIGTPGMFATMERDTLIMSQEALVRSESIFRAVKSDVSNKTSRAPRERSALNIFVGGVKRQIKVLLFGEEYVTTSDRLSKPAFDSYQGSVRFDSELDAGTFTIGFRDVDPLVAIETVRAISAELIKKNIDLANERWGSIATFLKGKLEDTENQLKDSNAEIASFTRENKVFNSLVVLEAKYKQLSEAQELLANTEQQLSSMTATTAAIETALGEIGRRAGEHLSSGADQRLEAALAEMKANEAALQQPYGVSAAQRKIIEDRTEVLRRAVRQTLRDESVRLTAEQMKQLVQQMKMDKSREDVAMVGAKARLKAIGETVKQRESEIGKLPDLYAQLQQMTVKHAQLQKVYEAVMQNYLSASIQSDVRVANIIVVDEPQIVTSLLSSSKARQLFTLSLGALMMAVLLSACFDFLLRKVVSNSQVQTRHDAELLGASNRMDQRSLRRGLLDGEAFQRIAASLARRVGADTTKARVIALTSSDASFGKTTAALGIATALRRRGARVALIDADVRATTRGAAAVWARLDSKNVTLTLQSLLQAAPCEVRESALLVAHVGISAADPRDIELTMRQRLPQAVTTLREHFDYVILDCAPHSFSEVAVAVELSEAVIACCRQGTITEPVIDDLIHEINQMKRPDARVFTLVTFAQPDGALRRNLSNYYGARNRAA